MKMKIFIACLAISLGLFSQAPQDYAAKVVEAIGGPAGMEKWSNFEAEGLFVYARSGMEIKGTMKLVQQGIKDWQRVALEFGGNTYIMASGYNGTAAWAEQMGNVSDQPVLNKKTEADHNIDLFLKKDVKWSLGKETELDGKKVIGLEAERQGKKTSFWIDPDTYLVLAVSYRDLMISDKEIKEEQDVRVVFQDYRKVDGTMFPMKRIFYIKGQKGAEVHFEAIRFNPKISSSLFDRPEKKLDLRYSEELIN